MIAIALIVDVPKGLDEGAAAVAYEGAEASLLEGFWLQIAAGAVLIACGLLLPRYLRPRPRRRRAAADRPDACGGRAASAAARARRGAAEARSRRAQASRPKRKVQGART